MSVDVVKSFIALLQKDSVILLREHPLHGNEILAVSSTAFSRPCDELFMIEHPENPELKLVVNSGNIEQDTEQKLIHLRVMLENFGIALQLVNVKTNESCVKFATKEFCSLVAADLPVLKQIGNDAIASRIPFSDRRRMNPVFIKACMDHTSYAIDARLEIEPAQFVWRRFQGNCQPIENDWVSSSFFVEAHRLPMIKSPDWRWVANDCMFALSEEMLKLPDSGWLVPLYQVSDFLCMYEEFMESLTPSLRTTTMEAVRRNNYTFCVSLVDKSPRWLAGLLLQDKTGFGVARTLPLLGSFEHEPISQQYTWALVEFTVAIVHPVVYIHSIEHLGCLIKQLARHPVKYTWQETIKFWLVLLWGCLLKVLGLGTEAKKVLASLYEDMKKFTTQNPCATSVVLLKSVVAHNMLHQYANDPEQGAFWLGKLGMLDHRVCMPKQCRETLGLVLMELVSLGGVSNGNVAALTPIASQLVDRVRACYPEVNEWIVQCAYSPQQVHTNRYLTVRRIGHVEQFIVCLIQPQPPLSSATILNAFTGVMFDVAFLIDSNMLILDDNSNKLSWFFAKENVSGESLNSFIPTEEDRERFRKCMESHDNIPCCVQLQLADLTSCSLFATLTAEANEYLIGVEIREHTQVAPPVVKSVRFSDAVYEQICDSSEAASSSIPSTDVIRDWVDCGHKKSRFRKTMRQFLNRDFAESMSGLLSSSDYFTSDPKWMIPRYVVSSPLLTFEEVVSALPLHAQGDFLKAMNENDYFTCSQLLENCMEGNANILSTSRTRLSSNVDLLHCVFRLFVSRVPHMPSSSAYTLLILLDNARKSVCASLGRLGLFLTGMEVSLALLSIAEAIPGLVSFYWLDRAFTDVFLSCDEMSANQNSFLVDTIFWLKLLWACATYRMGHEIEAVDSLKQLFVDTQTSCVKYPQATSIRQIQSIVCYNLAIYAMDSFSECLHWACELETVANCTYVTLPYACIQLIHWARDVQYKNNDHSVYKGA